ncbi:MAG: esterase family protein [Ferruginibacter sp.]|nr:esterase family protein [Ferruginibacter sp.]
MVKIIKLAFVFCVVVNFSFAAKVDTVAIYSTAMQKSINCVVVKPDGYKKKKAFSVVYLLHGYSGDYSNWIVKVPSLKKYADNFNLLLVCPDGGFSSWYFDSPIDTTYKYETHIVNEVVSYIDSHYKTIPNKTNRAITGLSMGGHGAFFLALRHPNIFGVIGATSGGVNLKESKNKYDIAKRIGDTLNYANNWNNLTIINLIEKYATTNQSMIFDCGIKDIFINGNRQLHQKMLQLNITHTYIEREGEHNWAYWQNAIPYQLLFFKNYFSTNH